jgi:WD40 repeat protein/serine/threonine protein kinase
MIAFACPHCDNKLRVKDELGGKQGRCPKCSRSLRIPRPDEPVTQPADLADEATLPPPDGKQSETRSEAGAGKPPAELYSFLAPAKKPDELGRLGPYRVLKVLGAGGMGVVFQAEDPALQRMVALKAMLPALAASPKAKARFLREARAAAAIEHDHIVPIHRVGEDRGVPFLAMQFLQGEPLDERLGHESPEGAGQPLPLPEILHLGRETAEGLQAAHEKGLIHRDIKPANIWLEKPRGRVKILDFGLARASDENEQITNPGAIMGTPSYMAPEQARGGKVDFRCDLFSLGCVLYQMATGSRPFQGDDAISTLMAVATEAPKAPRERNPRIPPALSDLIMHLLAKSPDDRPAGARVVAQELRTLEQGEADTARIAATAPGKSSEKDEPPRSRGRALALVGGAVVLLALAGGGVFVLRPKPDGVKTTPEEPGSSERTEKKPERLGALSPLALVSEPAPLPGLKSWSVAPRARPEPFRIIAYSPDGKRVAGGGADGVICLWTAEGKLLRMLLGHERDVRTLAFSPDGKRLASGGGDLTVRLWDAGTGSPLQTLTGRRHVPRGLAWSPGGKQLASAGEDHSVRLWEADTGKPVTSFTGHGAPVVVARWLDEKALFSWSTGNNTWLTWEADTRKVLHRLVVRGPQLWSPSRGWLVFKSGDKAVTFWNPRDGKVVRTLKLGAHKGPIARIALSPDGKTLATSWEKELYFWDADSGKPLRRSIPALLGIRPILGLAFSPDSRFLAVCGQYTHGVRLLDGSQGWRMVVRGAWLPGLWHTDFPGWSPDGRFVFANSAGTRCFWEATSGNRWSVPTYRAGAQNAAWSPDGKTLAAATQVEENCTVRLWDMESASLGRSFRLGVTGRPAFHPMAWSPDSKRLLTSSRNASMQVRNAATGKPGRTLGGKHRDWLRSIAWAPKGGVVFSHQDEGWFWARGKPLRALAGRGDFLHATFSPDGKTLATVNFPRNTIDLWEVPSGKHLRTLDGHKGRIHVLSWSPTGKLLASGGEDRSVRVWRANGDPVDRLAEGERQHRVTALGWLGEDRTLAVLSTTRSVCLWDVGSGRFIRSVAAPEGAGRFSPDGRLLASLHSPGGVRVWETETGAPRATLVYLRPEKPDLWLAVAPTGHYRAAVPRMVEREIAFVAHTGQGMEMLSPEEFSQRFGWKNDPEQVRIRAK